MLTQLDHELFFSRIIAFVTELIYVIGAERRPSMIFEQFYLLSL